jgi:hypothetical protein
MILEDLDYSRTCLIQVIDLSMRLGADCMASVLGVGPKALAISGEGWNFPGKRNYSCPVIDKRREKN